MLQVWGGGGIEAGGMRMEDAVLTSARGGRDGFRTWEASALVGSANAAMRCCTSGEMWRRAELIREERILALTGGSSGSSCSVCMPGAAASWLGVVRRGEFKRKRAARRGRGLNRGASVAAGIMNVPRIRPL